MFQKKVVEKIKIQTLCSVIFFLKVVPLKNMEKYGTDGQATDHNIICSCAVHAG
jgi:hypothetical protein